MNFNINIERYIFNFNFSGYNKLNIFNLLYIIIRGYDNLLIKYN